MSIVPVPAQENNGQTGLPKNMVLDLGWFNRDRTNLRTSGEE